MTSQSYPTDQQHQSFRKQHKCLAGCGKTITWRFAICSACEEIYGSSSLAWPEWLRFLWRSTLQERRQNARAKQHEVPLDIEEYYNTDLYDDYDN